MAGTKALHLAISSGAVSSFAEAATNSRRQTRAELAAAREHNWEEAISRAKAKIKEIKRSIRNL